MARCKCTPLLHKQEWIHSGCLLMQSNSYRQGSPGVCHKGIRECRYSAIVSWPRHETKESGWPASSPIRPPPPGRNRRYPLNISLGGPQDPSGHCRENSFSCRAPNPGLSSQRLSNNTDWATLAPFKFVHCQTVNHLHGNKLAPWIN
jgi:hypothetical protein